MRQDDKRAELIDGADELRAGITEMIIARLRQPRMGDLSNNVPEVVARFVLERQVAGVQAAVTLARASLGHLALPLVRPACDERIWWSYLLSLSDRKRHRLLAQMAMLESTRAVESQQQYLGKKVMKELGFSKSFVNSQAKTRTKLEQEISLLGHELDWPDDIRGFPSVGWVASQSGLGALYQFLYAATSKGVHFSPSEALRSGWAESLEPDAEVTIMADAYRAYRTDFSLHWLCWLLLETSITVWTLLAPEAPEVSEDVSQRFQAAADKIGALGQIPIVLAAEFNL